MSHDALLAEILRLPLAERHELLLAMLEPQDGSENDRLGEAMYAEVKRRCKLIEAGQVSFDPWRPDEATELESGQ